MQKFKFLILLFLFANIIFNISSEKFFLKNNWEYTIEKDGKPESWKKIDISLPIKKQGIELKKNESILYKKSFSIKELNDKLSDINNIGLYFGEIDGETKIFLNGNLIYESIYETETIQFKLNKNNLTASNEILLRIKKSSDRFSCQLNLLPYINDYNKIRINYLSIYIFQVIISILIFLFGLFYVFFYNKKINNSEFIFFFILCVCCSVSSFIKSPLKFYFIYNFNLNYLMIQKIGLISLYLEAFVGLIFLLKLFKIQTHFYLRIRNILGIISGTLLFLILILNFDQINKILFIYHISSILYILFYANLVLMRFFKNRSDMIWLVIGGSLLSLFILLTIAETSGIISFSYKLPFNSIGIFLFIFFLGIYLSKQFVKINLNLIDLTINLENKVEERTKQIELLAEQKTNYFLNLAHETKTPLTLISNYMEKYINENKNKDNIDLMIIKENIDKMSKDVVNFFDIEKLILGKEFYDNNQSVCLTNIINDKIDLYKNLRINSPINIKSDIEKNLYLKIDPFGIDRILNNLLDNAFKFSNNKSALIEVVLKSVEKKIFLSIKDYGIGIDENQLKNIFKPYYQIQSEKRNIQGMGLGLSIVKNIIDLIAGEIKVESKVNHGTCFTLIFNKYIPSNNEPIKQTKISMPYKILDVKLNQDLFIKGRHNILIVEDNVELINFLQENISKKHNCFLSLNGKDALEKIKSIPKPNIIISDIMMDEMDGYSFFNEIKKKIKYNNIPFIFLTAKTGKNDLVKGLSEGAIDYITKPFLIDELMLKIDSIIKNQLSQIEGIKNLVINSIEEIPDAKNSIDSNSLKKFNLLCDKYNISLKEKNILKLLLQGVEYKEISNNLEIPFNTVKKNIQIIFKKCKINNKIELMNLFKDNYRPLK